MSSDSRAGVVVRDEGHVAALEDAVLTARGQAGRLCRPRNAAPSPAALAEAARIRGEHT